MENNKLRDAGASKSAGQIIASFDPRLRDPARIIVRAWGYLLVIFICYLVAIGVIRENRYVVAAWVMTYSLYIASLEIIRRRWVHKYDEAWFHIIRISFNLVMITLLIQIIPGLNFIFSFAYLIPIFAGIVYFANNVRIGIATFIVAVIGMEINEILLPSGDRNPTGFLLGILGIAFFSVLVYWLYHRAINSTGQFSELVWELHRTLDIHELVTRTANNAAQITGASYCLVIIINPQHGGYFDHACMGFELRGGASMNDVAQACSVLSSGKPFDCSDMVNAFKENSIYVKFFKNQPRSVLAEPLFDSEGRIIGVINVAHDEVGHFEGLAKSQLKQFSGLVSSAIANCLSYRQAKLSEARDIDDKDTFVNVTSDEEIARILGEKIQMLLPNAGGYILHRFDPINESLIPIFAFPSQGSSSINWFLDKTKDISPTLRFGVGIAGQSLQLREPILVHNVREHPWFIEYGRPNRIKSLLTAPILDPKEETLYGTITVHCKTENAFTYQNEIVLTKLSCQAALSYTRVRKLNAWKEKGGVMKRIFDEMRLFDLDDPDEVLYKKITSAAIHTLDFGIARLRIIDEATDELVTTAISGVADNIAENVVGHRMQRSIIEPFLSSKYRMEHSFVIPHDDLNWQEIAKQYFYIPEQTANKQVGWRAYDALLTPLVSQSGQRIGLLSLDVPKDGLLPPPEAIEAIGVFASAAAWTIELARAQRRLTEQRTRAWSLLGSLWPKLASSQDFESLGELVVQFGKQILNTEGCSLHIVRGDELQLTHSTFLAGTKYLNRKKRITTGKKCGLSSWVATKGEILCCNNQQHKNHPAWAGEEDHLVYLESKQCHSLLIAPVLNKDEKVIGVITLENKKSLMGLQNFDDDDIGRIRSLASQFAQALDMIGQYELVQKWERKGIEDDLHELINWYHSGVVLRLDALAEWFRRKKYSKVASELPEILRRAYTSVNELKTIHTDLRNVPLETTSLESALRRMITAWSNRATLKYEGEIQAILNCPKSILLPEIIQNTLVRIASSAVANSIFHSGITEDPAISIHVEIKQEGGRISLKVSDNGRGKKHIKEGYGITRMRQLAAQLTRYGVTKPQFLVSSDPNKGTSIYVDMFVPALSSSPVNHK